MCWGDERLMSGRPELERVPRKVLRKDMDCPICGNPFLEGVYRSKGLNADPLLIERLR